MVCLVLGYPMAYLMSRLSASRQSLCMMLIMLPMWINFLLRTYAWMSILENNGFINQFFRSIGLISFLQSHFGYSLDYIPLYQHAGRDRARHGVQLSAVHGAAHLHRAHQARPASWSKPHRISARRPSLVFRRVIFPLSIPGVISGITMVFVPSVSTFVISQMLGSGKNLLVGDLIDLQFMGGAYNPHLGSAIALVMIILIFICMWIMNKFDDGSSEEGGLLL